MVEPTVCRFYDTGDCGWQYGCLGSHMPVGKIGSSCFYRSGGGGFIRTHWPIPFAPSLYSPALPGFTLLICQGSCLYIFHVETFALLLSFALHEIYIPGQVYKKFHGFTHVVFLRNSVLRINGRSIWWNQGGVISASLMKWGVVVEEMNGVWSYAFPLGKRKLKLFFTFRGFHPNPSTSRPFLV